MTAEPQRHEIRVGDAHERPHVLIVSPLASHPTDTGNRRRLLNLAATLEGLGYTPVLLYTDLFPGSLWQMRRWWGSRFYYQPYRPWSVRWWGKRLVRWLVPDCIVRWRRGWAKPQGAAKGAAKRTSLRGSVDQHYEPALDRRIDRLHQRYQFVAVVAEYVITSRALLRLRPPVRRLLDTHEVFAIGVVPATTPPEKLWLEIDESQELEAMSRADSVLAIQHDDAARLSRAGIRSVVTFGHPVEVCPQTDPESCLASRELLLVASGHEFDVDGLLWFEREVFPLLAECVRPEQVVVVGGIRDSLTGPRPPFRFLGWVPDLAKVYRQARVVIAPIRQGTGLKIKVVEALGQGKALVATPFAAKGVEAAAGRAMLLAGSPTEFAGAIRHLLDDDRECLRLMRGAQEFAAEWNRNQQEALRAALST